MKKPILTISILVSNNYENIKKCLDSIQPILKQVDSELILTDTGCDEKTRALIETYTDKIIDFEWVKDFSAARNVGLKAACGQWFMYVDDDEYFEDVTEIVDFFNSGEAEEYNVAFYVQRNYTDADGRNFVDHNVDRIIRITPELHFEHRVHEAYTGIEIGQKKMIHSFVHHYGYVYKDEAEKLAKYSRNQELLEAEVREFPTDMRMRYQMAINSLSVNDYDESIRLSFEAIKISSDSEFWDALHTNILYCYQVKKEWGKVVEYGNRFLKEKLFAYDEFGVRQYLICAYWSLGEYKKVCQLAKIVMETYRDYKKNPDDYNKNQLMRIEFWNRDHISKMILFIIDSVLHESDNNAIKSVTNLEVRDDVMELVKNDVYKNWFMQMVFGTCENMEQIELFEQLPICNGIWDVSLERFVWQIDLIFPRISLDKFNLWEEWILDHLAEGTGKEMYFLAKTCDYKLRSVKYQIAGMDDASSLEFMLSMMTGFAETQMYYCEAKYGDALDKMTEDELQPDESLAWDISSMVNAVDAGDVHQATEAVKTIATKAPYWGDAITFLPTYIQLVLGGN